MKSGYLWIQFELESTSLVERVHIVNAKFAEVPGQNAHQRTSDLQIRVGKSKYNPLSSVEQQKIEIERNPECNYYPNVVGNGNRVELTCNKRLFGKYVSIQILDRKVQIMNIAEVVIYGKSK